MNNKVIYFTNNIGMQRNVNLASTIPAKMFYSSVKSKNNYIIRFITYTFYMMYDLFRLLFSDFSFIIFEIGGKSNFIIMQYLLFIKILSIKGFRYSLDVHSKAAETFFKKKENKRIWNDLFNTAAFLILHNEDSIHIFSDFKSCLVESKIPKIKKSIKKENNLINVVFITTFKDDEPIEAMINATNLFHDGYHFYFTGNYKNKYNKPPTVRHITFTSFLEREEYINILSQADVLVILTTRAKTLVYGGREALALEKPMVLSATKTNKNYYKDAAVYVENNPNSIYLFIKEALAKKDKMLRAGQRLIREKNKRFDEQIERLKELINI